MNDWAPATAIAVIVMSFAACVIAKAYFAHIERIAKIERGINPDAPAPKDSPE